MFFDDPYYPLTIDGVSPNTSAWFLEDPQELFQPRQYAEVNHDQPGVPGKLPRDMIVARVGRVVQSYIDEAQQEGAS